MLTFKLKVRDISYRTLSMYIYINGHQYIKSNIRSHYEFINQLNVKRNLSMYLLSLIKMMRNLILQKCMYL